ncbi:unnamed protein product [Brachionus calyciflorus]|uniref:MULE transposase domain-containing protein n=1 Tax=Brachionus calyciflorus TaxID=104777 RepID=A0A813W5H5_9BILA|nr:unnamed protein product [Brachionus calyciflorus]
MTDFELAAINAFKDMYPNIQSKCCLFHFCQSLMKKFNTLGLKSEYQKNVDLKIWFKRLCSFAIIPIEYVNDFYFEKLCTSQPSVPKLDDFMLKDKEISVDTYVKYAIQTFDFSKIEAKLKDNDNGDNDSEAESIISNYSSSDESE